MPTPPTCSTGGSTSFSLLRKVLRRDPEGWRRFSRLYGPLVYRWARQAGLQDADAADIVQEVFRGVAKNLDGFDLDGGKFRPWLHGVTRNKITDFFRRLEKHPDAAGGTEARARLEALAEAHSDASHGLEGAFDADTSLLHRALDLIRVEFEPSTWTAFWRSTAEGASTADIAAALGMSKKAVRQAKYRVLRRLRAEMDDSM